MCRACYSAMKLVMRRIFFIVLSMCLLACAGNSTHAPVVERRMPVDYVPENHTVVRGETLYSIAWRYGLDHDRLTAANRIRSPYLIHPGQKLSLKTASSATKIKDSEKTHNTTAAGANKRAVSSASNKTKSFAGNNRKSSSTKNSSANSGKWYWPASGRLLTGYSGRGKVHKGIDIGGNIGDAVKSTQAGTVVYAGSGLTGYGKLVIVKHNSQYLSAYAHNSRILVAEGRSVKAGAKIAEMGRSGSTQTKLHFEIRRQGKPVDPLGLLPKR